MSSCIYDLQNFCDLLVWDWAYSRSKCFKMNFSTDSLWEVAISSNSARVGFHQLSEFKTTSFSEKWVLLDMHCREVPKQEKNIYSTLPSGIDLHICRLTKNSTEKLRQIFQLIIYPLLLRTLNLLNEPSWTIRLQVSYHKWLFAKNE